MKKIVIICLVGIVMGMGAGCSKKSTVATSNSSPTKDALIQRRVTDPPKPPENVPLPTPVNSVEVIK